MYTISKEFHFSASHILNGLPEEHPCSKLHGHNYIVTIELRSKILDGPGFVLDYRALEPVKKFINETFDHRHLNDVGTFNPTAENLAKYIFELCCDILFALRHDACVFAVTVKETEKTLARYEKDKLYESNPINLSKP